VNSDCKPLKGDILIAKDGANLNKHTFLVTHEREIVVLSSIAIIRPLKTVNAEYMVSMLRSEAVTRRDYNSRQRPHHWNAPSILEP
jgi:type I restriction enzyme, S subunit